MSVKFFFFFGVVVEWKSNKKTRRSGDYNGEAREEFLLEKQWCFGGLSETKVMW